MTHADGLTGRADNFVRPLKRAPETRRERAPETKSAVRLDGSMFPEGFFSLEGLAAPYLEPMAYGQTAKSAYVQNPIAHRCIRLVSEAISSLDLVVGDDAGETFDTHPLLALMRRPNDRQGGAEFLQTLVGQYLVAGDAYVHGLANSESEPVELHLLRPDIVKAIDGSDGWPVAYECGTGSRKRRIAASAWGEGGSVLNLSSFNPLSDTNGLSPLQSAQAALKVHNAAAGWNLALLENSARPSGALVFAPKDGSNLTDDQFARLKSELEDNYTGAKAAGRPLVLEGGLDWKAMGYSPKDMDFIEAKQTAAREIALALGVPPMLLGLPGDNTYSNYQEANRAFWRQTVVPLAKRILDGLSHWLAPFWSHGLRLSFDPEQIADLASDRDRLWQRLVAADFLTDDEKRAIVGYGPKTSTGKEASDALE